MVSDPELVNCEIIRSESVKEDEDVIVFTVKAKYKGFSTKKKAESLFKAAETKAMEIFNTSENKFITGKISEKENKKGTVYTVDRQFKGIREEKRARDLYEWLKDLALLEAVGQKKLDVEE